MKIITFSTLALGIAAITLGGSEADEENFAPNLEKYEGLPGGFSRGEGITINDQITGAGDGRLTEENNDELTEESNDEGPMPIVNKDEEKKGRKKKKMLGMWVKVPKTKIEQANTCVEKLSG